MRGLMQFQDADLKSLTFGSNEKDTLNAILVISAPLTSELADKLKVGYLFKPNGDPVLGPEGMALGYSLVDNDLTLPIGTTPGVFETYRAGLIGSFKIKRKDDLHLLVQFNAHISGDHQAFELLTFRKKYLSDKFECAIRSLQEEFRFDGATENDGTQVALSGGRTEEKGPLFQQPGAEPCSLCDREVPRNEQGFHMHEGELAACPRPVPTSGFDASNEGGKQEAGPVLASRASMGLVKPRRGQTRRPSAEEIDANLGAVDDSQTAVGV